MNLQRLFFGILGLIVLSCAVGCETTPTEFELEIRGDSIPGVLGFFGDTALVTIPDTASAGTPFAIRITTHGGAVGDSRGNPACVRKGATKVDLDERAVTIEVIDILWPPLCTLAPNPLDHSVTLAIAAPGEYTVRVVGRRVPENTVQVITGVVRVR